MTNKHAKLITQLQTVFTAVPRDGSEPLMGAAVWEDALKQAADALQSSESVLLTAPVTDDEIDAAFDALDLLRESTTVEEMRRALEGFAAGRAERAFPPYTAPRTAHVSLTHEGNMPVDYEDSVKERHT